jgi:hypothetical protein
MYNGECSNALTCLAEKCPSLMYMPMWLSGESLSPVYVIAWSSEKRMSPVGAQLAVRHGSYCRKGLESHRRHGRTRGNIIIRRRGKPDGTPVLFFIA